MGYYDGAEEPTPIRLVARGKDLAEGEVFETQSDEIRFLGMVWWDAVWSHKSLWRWISPTQFCCLVLLVFFHGQKT